MNKKDPRLKVIYQEIKKLKRRLSRAQKGLGENTGNCAGREYKNCIAELKNQLAWALLDAGENENGLAMYQTLSWRTHAEMKFTGMARALIEMEYYNEARKLLGKGLSRFPESVPLLIAMGCLHQRLDNDFEALKYFEQAVKFTPDGRNALYNKALSLNNLGYYEDAEPIIKDLIEKYPDDPEYLVEMGYIDICRGYPEEAIPFYKKAKDAGYLNWSVYDGLFWSYYNMGLKNDALEIAIEGIKELPDSHSRLYGDLSSIYKEMGWIDEAKDILKKGLEVFPEDNDLMELLKEIEDEENNPDNGKKPPIKEILIVAALIKKLRNMRIFRPKK
ncbi:MAG: hypothetical protein NTW44_08045 [Nitrospirae bacterium]|nr:hypothetical protein [Nitrospirota bacterium]